MEKKDYAKETHDLVMAAAIGYSIGGILAIGFVLLKYFGLF